MAGVVADPRSLRELRSAIQRSQTDIDRAAQAMRTALKNTNWNDDRRRQFERNMEGFLSSLTNFAKQADEMRAYLGRKADELDRYLAN